VGKRQRRTPRSPRSQSSIRPGDDSDKILSAAIWRTLQRRNPVFALEMIQTLENFGVVLHHNLSRNPVFALEMIQTVTQSRTVNVVAEQSQSSIRPGDDSDSVSSS